jgi:predicted TIM-barrel fold metal-dependent hydrolase
LCGIAGARGQTKCASPHQVVGQWADLFRHHPFILAHAGSHRILDAWEMASNRDNVFLDLSHTLHYLRGSSVERDIGFVARRLDRRALFGSDFPESSIPQAIEHLDHYLEPWPDTNRNGILGGNWSKILNRADDFFDKRSDA